MKGLDGRGLEQKEKTTMRLIASFELASRSDSELAAIFGHVSRALNQTKEGSPARRNALASLENIRREQAARRLRPRP